jgi:8-oxo-(d)GTP phosphatase
MPLLLVRHATAVPSAGWTAPDRDRELTDVGRREATQLATVCAPYDLAQILCSPALRCVQTIEPVARSRSIDVRTNADLGEGRRLAARDVVKSLRGTDALVCTHNDVLHAIVRDLVQQGVEAEGTPRWTNAEVWALTEEPTVTRLTRLGWMTRTA